MNPTHNHSAQPRSGERFGVDPKLVARPGWPDRSARVNMTGAVLTLVLICAIVAILWVVPSAPRAELRVAYLGETTNGMGQSILAFSVSNACTQAIVRLDSCYEFAPESRLPAATLGFDPPTRTLKPGEVERFEFPAPGFKKRWRLSFPYRRQGLRSRVVTFLRRHNPFVGLSRSLRSADIAHSSSEWFDAVDSAPNNESRQATAASRLEIGRSR